MIIAFLIALGVSFFSALWYFGWVRRSLERAMKEKKADSFRRGAILRMGVALLWTAGMAILFGRMPALLAACVIGIFLGRAYAFKSR